jgi:hypothetical protein
MKAPAVLLLTVFVFGWAPSLSAHHPLADLYERDSSITVTGRVSRVEWINPHVVFHLSVQTEDEGLSDWTVELDAPHQLSRRGWSRDSLGVGDTVTVVGYRALDAGRSTAARTVTFPEGESLAGTDDMSWNWRRLEPN